MSSPITNFLSVPGRLTFALKERETQTFGDWHPSDSLWMSAWNREVERRHELTSLADRYIAINFRREDLPQKQVDMPPNLVQFFGPSDTKFGRGDENHRSIRVLADIAVTEPNGWTVHNAVELIQRIVTDYADDPNSYLSLGGVTKNGKLGYLGSTGRWRKWAMIVAMIGYDVPRVYRLPGWTIPRSFTEMALLHLLNFHIDHALDDEFDMSDEPKPDHLPYDRYLCCFQMGLAVAAAKMAMLQPWPMPVKDKLAKVISRLRTWIPRGYQRDAGGAICGVYYDVKWPDWENTATAPGNVPFVHPTTGKNEDAHGGMGVALHLANIDSEFDTFLRVAKAKELKSEPALAVKFGLEP